MPRQRCRDQPRSPSVRDWRDRWDIRTCFRAPAWPNSRLVGIGRSRRFVPVAHDSSRVSVRSLPAGTRPIGSRLARNLQPPFAFGNDKLMAEFEKRFLALLLSIATFAGVMSCVMSEAGLRQHWMSREHGLLVIATSGFLLAGAILCGYRCWSLRSRQEPRVSKTMAGLSGVWLLALLAQVGIVGGHLPLLILGVCLCGYLVPLSLLHAGSAGWQQRIDRQSLPIPTLPRAAITAAALLVLLVAPSPFGSTIFLFVASGLAWMTLLFPANLASLSGQQGQSAVSAPPAPARVVLQLESLRNVAPQRRRAA